MGRRIPKQVYVVTNEKLGISIPVMLRPDLTFSAAFQGKRFNAATAEEVQKWCWDAMKRADDLVWKPVIAVSYMEGRDQRPYTRIPNAVGFDFDRFYLAKRMDGTILKSQWELIEGTTRTQIAARFYDSEALGDLSEWPVKVSHKFSGDPTIVYIEYTDDLWTGLEKLSEAIEMLRETLTGFLGSKNGHERLVSIGKSGLPALPEVEKIIGEEVPQVETEKIRKALLDILDGTSQWWDIQDFTGLPEDRCKEIAALHDEISREA